jgi:hypothetical protein
MFQLGAAELIIMLFGVGRISKITSEIGKGARKFCMDTHDDVR